MCQTHVCGLVIAAALGFAPPANAGMVSLPTIRPSVQVRVSPPKVTGAVTGGTCGLTGTHMQHGSASTPWSGQSLGHNGSASTYGGASTSKHSLERTMPPTLTYPGVYIQELPGPVHSTPGVGTSGSVTYPGVYIQELPSPVHSTPRVGTSGSASTPFLTVRKAGRRANNLYKLNR